MPLRDHFRSPVNDKHSWDQLHGLWPGMMVRELFDLLPPGFQATAHVHLGAPFEIDVSAYEEDGHDERREAGGGVATLPALEPSLSVEDRKSVV